MYHCDKCGKEYEKRHAYIGHCRVHSDMLKPKLKTKRIRARSEPVKTKCQYCNSNFDSSYKLGGHIPHCKLNPNYENNLQHLIKSNQNKDFKWSEEDKKRIGNSMLKYLKENPNKVPYLTNHSSKISYPEKIFKNALEVSNISGWTYNYQNGIYSYDFAFIEKKIDVEIDGGTHLLEKVKKIDERRDVYSKENGWIVIRFTAKEVKENVLKCINTLKIYL